ncbi:hypothetical protein AAG570_012305 [Ranatra chinensis]|uniref:Uncharacterized protein n=1 Tax=Ranatra chinensis TaxID=642074 RepID=A0ABD0Z0N5_9HEMI
MPTGRRSTSPSPASSVRCACQYFQSSDPLPERRSLVGTPPPFATPQHPQQALDQHTEPHGMEDQPPPQIVSENRHKDMGRPETSLDFIYRMRRNGVKRRAQTQSFNSFVDRATAWEAWI